MEFGLSQKFWYRAWAGKHGFGGVIPPLIFQAKNPSSTGARVSGWPPGSNGLYDVYFLNRKVVES
jgi:hypothetical protein